MVEDNFEWKLGEILVRNGWVTWDQLEKALETQQQSRKGLREILYERQMIDREKEQLLNLGEILLQNGWIDWERLKAGLELQQRTGRRIGEILVDYHLVERESLYRALAIQHGKLFIDFRQIQVSHEVLKLVPRRMALDLKIMPLACDDDVLLIAISDPLDVRAERELEVQFPRLKIRSAVAFPEAITLAIQNHYIF